MLKTLVLALSIVAVLGIAFVTAEEEKKITITKSEITGDFVRFDPDARSFVIMDTATGKELTYVFTEKTTFYRDGSVIEVTTLKPKEKVTLKLSPDDEKVILRLDTPKIVVEEED